MVGKEGLEPSRLFRPTDFKSVAYTDSATRPYENHTIGLQNKKVYNYYMKTCSKCNSSKPESEYYVKDSVSRRLHAQCKMCYKEHRITYYKEHYEKFGELYRHRARARKARIKNELRHKLYSFMESKRCVQCGERDLCVLEFDHIDPDTKAFGIAKGLSYCYDWQKILKEIRKCQILCANCHKRKTAKQQGWFKAIQQ